MRKSLYLEVAICTVFVVLAGLDDSARCQNQTKEGCTDTCVEVYANMPGGDCTQWLIRTCRWCEDMGNCYGFIMYGYKCDLDRTQNQKEFDHNPGDCWRVCPLRPGTNSTDALTPYGTPNVDVGNPWVCVAVLASNPI